MTTTGLELRGGILRMSGAHKMMSAKALLRESEIMLKEAVSEKEVAKLDTNFRLSSEDKKEMREARERMQKLLTKI